MSLSYISALLIPCIFIGFNDRKRKSVLYVFDSRGLGDLLEMTVTMRVFVVAY